VESSFVLILLVALALLALLLAVRRRRPKPLTVLICGATGVGKSTIVNVLCRQNVSLTGIGNPVTQNTVRIEQLALGLAFYDSRGLEVEDASRTYLLLMSDLLNLRFGRPVREQIDLALMCIQEPQGRIDDAHLEIAALCEDLQVPLGVALTKTEANVAFEDIVREMFPRVAFVRRVRALELRTPRVVIPPEGIDDLLADLRSAGNSRTASRGGILRRVRARKLASAARQLARKQDASNVAWISFGPRAAALLGLRRARWNRVVAAIRKDIRKALVAGFFRRNVLTKFDQQRIDAAIMRRLLPSTMRRFADGSGTLTPNDIATATTEATEFMRHARPYRSRF
jgi:DNA helicase HerA-like ATPase